MISFEVNDMTCGHCVNTITKALKAVNMAANVQIDLSRHLVHIEPDDLDINELGEAIREAGYTPQPVGISSAPAAEPSSGGCCGCR